MSPQPRDVLVDIVAQYGLPVLKSPLRCEGLLKDYCGEHRREIAALMKCLRAGVVDQFGQQNGTPIKTVCTQLATTFEQTPDMSKAMARWTIESWAVALGLLDPTAATALFPELVSPPSPAPEKTSPDAPSTPESVVPSAEEKSEDAASPAKSDFLAKVFTPGWPVPDWSRPQRQVLVHPDGSGQKPTLREAMREADETTCLLLKPGRYKDALVIKKNLQIRGEGDPAEIIIESPGASVVLLDGACLFVAGVTLKGTTGKDKKAVAAVEVKSGHLAMEYCNLTSDSATIMEVKGAKSEVILRHCHLHDGKAGGIVFQDSAVGYLEECDFYQNKLSHVVIGKGCAPTLLSCKISNAMMAGLYVNDGGAGLIENCDIWGNAVAGIQCQRKGNPRVRLCRISLNQRYGVLVTERGEGSFEKCQIFDNARSGVTISQQSLPKFSGCQIFDNHGEGMEISDQSQGEAIDCEIFSNENANIAMKDKSTMLFRDCQVRDGQQEGIRLTGGADGRFEKCSIYSNAKTGLSVTQSKPVFQECQFYNGMEIGIKMGNGSDGQFTGCTFTGHSGTAVVIGEKSQSRFERCDISRNLGMGVYVDDGSAPTFQNCTMNENRGVGFTCIKAGIPKMVEGEINGNAGGLLVSGQGKGRWEKVSFIGNSGAGVEIEDGGNPTLRQIRVVNGKGTGILVHALGAGSAEKCEVHDNAEGDWKVPETARLKRVDS